MTPLMRGWSSRSDASTMTSGRLSVSVGTSFSRSVADLPDQEPRRPDWILRQQDPYRTNSPCILHYAVEARPTAFPPVGMIEFLSNVYKQTHTCFVVSSGFRISPFARVVHLNLGDSAGGVLVGRLGFARSTRDVSSPTGEGEDGRTARSRSARP